MLLSFIVFFPLVGVLLIALWRDSRAAKGIATLVSMVDFFAALAMIPLFDPNQKGFQLVIDRPWIESFGIHYLLGIDGLSYVLVLLTTLLSFIAVYCSYTAITEREREYYAFLLLLEAGMLGALVALDLFLFYVFWEVMLVPMYFLIGVWGSENKLYAAIKFFLYTLFGSVLILIGILLIYFHYKSGHDGTGTFRLVELIKSPVPAQGDFFWGLSEQWWVFLLFFVGFAIKVPMFPFHTWLPDAHVEAPTAGSVILAGVLLKMGTYAFIRFSLPLLPEASVIWAPYMMYLSLIAIIYGALVCMMQKDMKKLIAYSSVSHMGFVTAGLFALNYDGLAGSIIQQLNHGLSTGALFLIVGLIYERRHTKKISDFGGLSQPMPIYAALFLLATLSSIGMPGLNGFIGEFTILVGVFQVSKTWAVLASLGIILGAAYMLWLYQRVMFGPCDRPENQRVWDLNGREILTLVPLVILMFWIGLYPAPTFNAIRTSVESTVETLRSANEALYDGYTNYRGASPGGRGAGP
jgi:NADH-quinone oxidoreductase subunit M